MAPWPNQPCPHCKQTITDLLVEMVPDAAQQTPAYAALVTYEPGGAITCPYCQGAVEFATNGIDLVPSTREPLRLSRTKVETRARRFGEVFLGELDTTPQAWVESDRAMPGALIDYRYAEDEP